MVWQKGEFFVRIYSPMYNHRWLTNFCKVNFLFQHFLWPFDKGLFGLLQWMLVNSRPSAMADRKLPRLCCAWSLPPQKTKRSFREFPTLSMVSSQTTINAHFGDLTILLLHVCKMERKLLMCWALKWQETRYEGIAKLKLCQIHRMVKNLFQLKFQQFQWLGSVMCF